MPQTFSTIFPLSKKIDLIRLTPYHWQTYVSKVRDIREERVCKIFCAIRNVISITSRCVFCKKFCTVILFWCTKFQNAALSMVRNQTDYVYFADKGSGAGTGGAAAPPYPFTRGGKGGTISRIN